MSPPVVSFGLPKSSFEAQRMEQCGKQKMSHLQPSVEVGMKNVDKNIDERNKQGFGSENAS